MSTFSAQEQLRLHTQFPFAATPSSVFEIGEGASLPLYGAAGSPLSFGFDFEMGAGSAPPSDLWLGIQERNIEKLRTKQKGTPKESDGHENH